MLASGVGTAPMLASGAGPGGTISTPLKPTRLLYSP